MILQAAAEIGELNRRDRSRKSAIFFRVQPLLAGIHEDAVPVNLPLFLRRSVRLPSIVEGDAVGPHVLVALSLLLGIVVPVHRIPVEVDTHIVLERGPNRRASVGGGRIDGDCAAGRPAAVIEPVFVSERTFARGAFNVKSFWARTPDIDRPIESLDVLAGDKNRQRASRPWI